MYKKEEKLEWCVLWQEEGKTIEEVLKDALKYFLEKYKDKPKKIYVNTNIELKTYDGISLVPDKQMYSKGIIALVV